jgi:hypothetical protein
MVGSGLKTFILEGAEGTLFFAAIRGEVVREHL